MTHEIRLIPNDDSSVEVHGDVRPSADYLEPIGVTEDEDLDREPVLDEEPLSPSLFLDKPFQISDLLEQGLVTEDQATVLGDIIELQQKAQRISQSSAAPRLHGSTRRKLNAEAVELSRTGDKLTSELFWLNPEDEQHQQAIISLRVRFRNHVERPLDREAQDETDTVEAGTGNQPELEREIDRLVDTRGISYDEAYRLLNG